MKKLYFAIIFVLILLLAFFSFNFLTAPTLDEDKPYLPKGENGEEAGENNLSDDLGLTMPEGFFIKTYAEDLGKVRDITTAPGGIIVSSMNAGKVVYLADRNQDKRADEQKVLLDGLYNPHGLLEYCPNEDDCRFYIAETSVVSLYDYDKQAMTLTNRREILDLPDDGGHYTRHIVITKVDGEEKLLTTVGSKCNVCVEEDWRRAKILQSNLDGSNPEVFAEGLRNSVFMEKNPVSGEVWATDMGRDWLGDDLPPEEVNIIREGQDYGWPYCYGDKVHDTDFDKNTYLRDPCVDTVAPEITMQAHIAPLGLAFIPEEGWPEEYWYDLLVAQHGSWNRSSPVGYKVVRMKLDENGNFSGQEDFVSGFLEDGDVSGRPVDVYALPGGVVYLSDDKGGRVFMIYYKS